MNEPALGLVLRARAGFYDVETETGVVQAQLRGRLRRESDEIAIGDRVLVRVTEGGKVMIESMQPRERVLSRRDPGREAEQVLIANPDQAVFVFACADPDPNFRLMDRLLVMAESVAIPSLICANKVDLVKPKSAKEEFGEYRDMGYPVLYTSALKGKGVKALRKRLKDKISVFAGPSGVGKSTLLNAIQPGLGLRTEEVSDIGLGAHTTVVRELLPLESGGYVADSPGLRAFALWDIEPEELDGYMPDLAALVDQCEFSDCTHIHEPGCAVVAAVEAGQISPERYDSYLRMREGAID
ncbi:MAG: ribosome small subunit-dependent GTPase A [Anaerolineales bacterium]